MFEGTFAAILGLRSRILRLAKSTTLTFFSISIVALSIILQTLAPDYVGTIDPASVRQERGLAYTVELKQTSPYVFWRLPAGDKSGTSSNLVLFEDGQQLSQAHALHDDIRLLGKGRYSHWDSKLYFSSTDATSPSRGSHVYSFRVTQRSPLSLKYAVLGCAVILLFQALFGSRLVWRIALVISAVGLVIYFMCMGHALWGSWTLIDLEPDSEDYLWPAATALLEGHWARTGFSFGYPLLAYEAIKVGSSLQALVAVQLMFYVTGSLLLYAVVLTSLFTSFDVVLERSRALVVAHLFATAAAFAYFTLSSRYQAFVFYVGPELVVSMSALLALFLCLLLINYRHPAIISAALALAAAVCAALLVAFKPSMTAIAGLTLFSAAWGLIRRQTLSRLVLAVILAAMVALPTAVFVVDGYFARKYGDAQWDMFGPLTAFCNNAPLIADNLQTPNSAGNRLLGESGARDVAAFLRAVIEQHPYKYAGPIEGYNGDVCQFDLWEWRQRLESKYFGATSQEVARKYRSLIIGSILEAPGSFAERVVTQMKAYVAANQVTCETSRQPQRRLHSAHGAPWLFKGELVDKLVATYGFGLTDQSLPSNPGTDSICYSSGQMVRALQLPMIGTAVILALIYCGWRRLHRREVSPGATAVLLTTGFWLSGAAVVALVHTFDVSRYYDVMFPIFVATFAIASGYILELALRFARRRKEVHHLASALLRRPLAIQS